MSGSNNEIDNPGGPASSAEPSMEEILASIRRILKDDQPAAPDGAEAEEDVFGSGFLHGGEAGAPGRLARPMKRQPRSSMVSRSRSAKLRRCRRNFVDPTFEDELQSHSYSDPGA